MTLLIYLIHMYVMELLLFYDRNVSYMSPWNQWDKLNQIDGVNEKFGQ